MRVNGYKKRRISETWMGVPLKSEVRVRVRVKFGCVY